MTRKNAIRILFQISAIANSSVRNQSKIRIEGNTTDPKSQICWTTANFDLTTRRTFSSSRMNANACVRRVNWIITLVTEVYDEIDDGLMENKFKILENFWPRNNIFRCDILEFISNIPTTGVNVLGDMVAFTNVHSYARNKVPWQTKTFFYR